MTIAIIAGGRGYRSPQPSDLIWLDQMLGKLGILGVVTGGASGADDLGRRWAEDLDIPVRIFKPDWSTHGSAAGPIRNQQMADFLLLYHQRAVLLFPGGRGTASMRNIAKTSGIEVYDFTHLTPSP